ncbi:MAG: endonuclease/exonuclease/phosphatase family protein [Syntrophorhabdales bacterium]|jgi:endonuclease/exonuclease/phosphatase (EEP) superfamily protein YafD
MLSEDVSGPAMTTSHRGKVPIWFLTLTCAYGAILAVVTALDRLGADRWWFGALNLYLPQMAWAVPGILLAVLSLKAARRWVWAPLLCVAWVLGPIMGFCWHTQAPPGSADVRIMTWNVKYGGNNKVTQLAITYDIDAAEPDVVLLQDAGGLLNGPIGRFFQGWNVCSFGQYVIASKLPLDEAEVRLIPFPGENHTCLRCRLRIGAKTLILYNVHFQSPRQGLDAFREARKQPSYLPSAVQQLEDNVEARLSQARALGELIRQEREPVVVGGDLNSPDASLACATLREAGLHDAFAEGGKGYGYTYGHFLLRRRLPWLGTSWMRIDHVMLSPQLQSRACRAGTANVSEHRPVIADVVLGRGT